VNPGRTASTVIRAVILPIVALALALPLGGAGFPARLPMNARQWNERGIQLMQQQQWAPAIEAFGQAIQLEPQRPDLLLNRARAYQSAGQLELAEADCSAAAQLDSEETLAFLQRALIRTELGRQEAAFRDASRAVRMAPENEQCVFARYLVASRIGRHDLGHTAGETYIGIHGWNDASSPYIALLNYVALRRAGSDTAAHNTLAEAAASLSPDQWPTPVILYLRGELDESALLSLAHQPERAALARYYMGVRSWLEGDLQRAMELFRTVATTGESSLLQTKLAADHLKELSRTGPPGPASSKE